MVRLWVGADVVGKGAGWSMDGLEVGPECVVQESGLCGGEGEYVLVALGLGCDCYLMI